MVERKGYWPSHGTSRRGSKMKFCKTWKCKTHFHQYTYCILVCLLYETRNEEKNRFSCMLNMLYEKHGGILLSIHFGIVLKDKALYNVLYFLFNHRLCSHLFLYHFLDSRFGIIQFYKIICLIFKIFYICLSPRPADRYYNVALIWPTKYGIKFLCKAFNFVFIIWFYGFPFNIINLKTTF